MKYFLVQNQLHSMDYRLRHIRAYQTCFLVLPLVPLVPVWLRPVLLLPQVLVLRLVSAIVGSCRSMSLALVQHLCQSAVAGFAHPVVELVMALAALRLLWSVQIYAFHLRFLPSAAAGAGASGGISAVGSAPMPPASRSAPIGGAPPGTSPAAMPAIASGPMLAPGTGAGV